MSASDYPVRRSDRKMKAILFTAATALAAAEAQAADTLTRDEIAKLPFMTALAYAEAIDAYCLPEWHYASTALATAAITQADLQDGSYVGAEQTHEASRLKADRSACEPAKAFVDKVTATIPKMQPKMEATLASLKKEETLRDTAQARAARIAQCNHVVATVKAFLAAKWSLANSGHREELPRCVTDLTSMPEAGDLLAEAKMLLPQMTERHQVAVRDGSCRAGTEEADPKRVIADWCAKQTEKTALCDEASK